MNRRVRKWAGFVPTVAFALYNGWLGLYHGSLWHGSICVYYILLSALRGVLLLAEGREEREGELPTRWKKRIFYSTWGLMLALNVALTHPTALMVLSRRPVSMGMIPAIASATYTTYKTVVAGLGLRKKRKNIFARELGLLRFADALVSVLVLQNTLITVVDGKVRGEMFLLSAVTSAGIFLLVFGLSLLWFGKERRSLKKQPAEA